MGDNQTLLGALYPHMTADRRSKPELQRQTLLQSVQLKAQQSIDTKQAFFAEHAGTLIEIASALADCYRKGGRLLCAGNGGSSCDAAHVALEFMHPVTAGRPALPAINLSQDSAMLTAVCNDLSFEHVLPRQLIALAQPNDLLLVFSTSGNSKNISAACNKAKQLGLTVAAFSGCDGGELAQSANVDHCLVVQADSVHRIQECHLTAYHILWDLVHTLLAESRGSLGEQNPMAKSPEQ